MENSIINIKNCFSEEELKARDFSILLNIVVWIFLFLFIVSSSGLVLILYFIILGFNRLVSELDVRKIRAVGVTVSEKQFPLINQALLEVCSQFKIKKIPTVIVINHSETNALAVHYANKHVIVLYSQLLESALSNTNELKFILGHEIAHLFLRKGFRSRFNIVMTPFYHAGREQTCDNVGLAASGNLQDSITALRMLSAGHTLSANINTEELEAEAVQLYSGIYGWLLKHYLSYPSAGKRITNIRNFCDKKLYDSGQMGNALINESMRN
jgi:Zn-dependent protease with chaperone function